MSRDARRRNTSRLRVGYRGTWLTVVGLAVLVGCIAAPLFRPADVLTTNALALFVVVTLVSWMVRACLELPMRSILLGGVRMGLVGAAGMTAATTYVEAAGMAVWWLVAAAVVTSPWVTGAAATRLRPSAGDPGPASLEEIPPGPAPVWLAHPGLVGSMSTTDLLCAWRSSRWQLPECRSAAEVAHLVRVRQAYLDELERRDPVGMTAWIRSAPGPGTDPGAYLSADSGSADAG